MTERPITMPSELIQFVPTVEPVDGAADELVTIGRLYWELEGFDEQGAPAWRQNANAIDTTGWGRQTYVIAAAGVRALLPEVLCPQCNAPLRLRSRTDLAYVIQHTTGVRRLPSCVACDPNLTQAIRRLTDPAASAARERARAQAAQQRAHDQAAQEWQARKAEIIAAHHPITLGHGWSDMAITDVRAMVAVLALLRFAPTATPIEPVSDWMDPIHPDREAVRDLLGAAVRNGLLYIHPGSSADAFIWENGDFEAALLDADGDLEKLKEPVLVARYYPLAASHYAPFGPSMGTAAETLDSMVVSVLQTVAEAEPTEPLKSDLLDLVSETIAVEALRYFDHRLWQMHLPEVPQNHRPRLVEAARKAAQVRSLGEVLNLAWQSTASAAEAAQRNPRAPRVNMSTHAVNRFESLAQAATDPEWAIHKVFTTMIDLELTAMTRVLFHTVFDADPFQTRRTALEAGETS